MIYSSIIARFYRDLKYCSEIEQYYRIEFIDDKLFIFRVLYGKMIKVGKTIGNLSGSASYQRHLDRVKEALSRPVLTTVTRGSLEDEPEYQLIMESNDFLLNLDEEIGSTQTYISSLYKKKFPELEALVPNKLDYIKAVQKIGNEMDLTLVDLSSIVSAKVVMLVSVAASTTEGMPLSDGDLSECMHACEEARKLYDDKSTVLSFVESRMSRIAPNLSALAGTNVAAQLVGLAGGLTALSKIPSCNIQVIGQEKKNLAGLSMASTMPHAGVLATSDIVADSDPEFKRRALKVLAGKVSLAARIDCYQTDFSNEPGLRMRREVLEHFEKLAEPQQARTKKALPIPEEKRTTKRGGRRARAMKERFGATDLQKAQNKMSFTDTGGEYGDSAMGFDVAVGSKEGGKLRGPAIKESKFTANKQQKRAVSASSGQTGGLSSSLVFTPVQGLELVNPNAAAERVRQANNKWFNPQSGFLSAAPK